MGTLQTLGSPRVRRRGGWRAVGVLVALLLVPAACGGGDDDDPAGDEATTGTGQEGGEGTDGSAPGGGDGGEGGGSDGTGGGGSGLGAVVGEGAQGSDSLTGTWEGSYLCAQGETPLELTLLDVADDGTVEGFFEFGPVPGEDVSGNYRLTGTHEGGTLTLEGLDWVEQAEGYDMVGLEAETGDRDDPEQLEGTIVGAGCETFSVERTSSEPWYVGTWEGGYICAQGRTGMRLTIESTGGNGIEALYEFFPLPDGPDVPPGSYEMSGAWIGGGLALEGDRWVEQPPDYLMVPISSASSFAIGPDRLAGNVDDISCEAFILERVEG